jgi:uncharacterized SAM-binding protein YcdF (DUF218 family)
MFEAAWVRTLAKLVLLPPAGLLFAVALGLLLLRRSPRLGRFLAWSGCVLLLLLSLPVVSTALHRALWDGRGFDESRPPQAGAIVILGGGVRVDAREYGGDTVGRLTLERVRYGARIARLTRLPVLVTGGTSTPGAMPEAIVMRQVLEQEFAVPVRWVEAQSRNTRENAQLSARMLAAAGVQQVILVAHAFDMRRARAEFAAAGMAATPAPTMIPVPVYDEPAVWWPSAGALQLSYYVLYELFANAALALGGGPPAAGGS